MRQIGKSLLLTCCLWLLTGPLLLLQLGAWGLMLASYSQQSSLEQAIIETFGGDRPCEICKFIQATDTESKPAPEQKANDNSGFKLLPVQTADISTAPAYSRILYRFAATEFYPYLYYKVPTPPPRG